MSAVLSALNSVQLGKSVAEKDECLNGAFVDTSAYHNLMNNNYDIIEGDKGAGKTALFLRLLRPESYDQRLSTALVVRGCNVKGEPFFQRLAEGDALNEIEYIRFWKGYILARAGNWVLSRNKYSRNSKSLLYKLEQLLRGLDLYASPRRDLHQDLDLLDARDVFDKALRHIGNLFRWKAVGVSVDVTPEGLSFTPKIDFAKDENQEQNVSIESALGLLDQCLANLDKPVWVAIDRLDEAFQGFPEAEIPALRGIFRAYRDLDEYPHITLKIFVRRDLFARIIKGGFVNLTHINASKLTLDWDEEDLKTLICNRVRQNPELCSLFNICDQDNETALNRILPHNISNQPAWPWIMNRIRDGNGAKPPRNLIDMIKFAIESQIERDTRSSRDVSSIPSVIDEASLISAARRLSVMRLGDTLLAESPLEASAIKLFKGSGSRHNKQSISALFSHADFDLDDKIQRLVFLGFLEEDGQYYNIPHLYRGGLDIAEGLDKWISPKHHTANDE